ncbi:MAG: EFR1 family ferrodoxin [Methanobrevibacter sp.]|nr:EFR1 family ferrodoxin [Methanobrevibacter sp.]
MIFYFTGTGNSLYVAKKIQKVDGGELVNIGQALNENNFSYTIEKGEKVGIVFPVYYWGLPTIVSEFVKKLKLETSETPFIYTVITCGSFARNADNDLAKLLKSKNLELNSSYSVKMPSNYVMLYNTPNKEDTNLSLELADNQIEKLIEDVKNNKKGYFATHGPFTILGSFVYKTYGIFRKTKKFNVNEKCRSCGQCERICPSQAIHIKEGNPEWVKEKCSHCTACINRCPSKAIEYGNSTKKRGRYINPNVKFNNDLKK